MKSKFQISNLPDGRRVPDSELLTPRTTNFILTLNSPTFDLLKLLLVMKKLLIGALALITMCTAEAQQLNTPQPSPTANIKQNFALSSIEISYSRPGIKGRKIFGDLVPYGKVWRTGANEATTIEITKNAKIEGKFPLAASLNPFCTRRNAMSHKFVHDDHLFI